MDNIAPTQITASVICDALGRKAIADACGVGLTAVSNASVENRFPAKWFRVVRSMCDAVGQGCPEDLFSFIESAAAHDAHGQQQGAE